MTGANLNDFLAKSDGTTLLNHTKYVCHAAVNLLNSLPLPTEEKERLLPKLLRCAVLHDIGKAHRDFQKKLNGEEKNKVSIRHELISTWLSENFTDIEVDELFAIATHHKGVINISDSQKRLSDEMLHDEYYNYFAKKDPALLTVTFLQGWNSAHPTIFSVKNTVDIENKLSSKITRLLKQSQQKKVFPNFEDRLSLAKMRGLLIAADHTGSARHEDEIPQHHFLSLQDFQPKDKKTGEKVEFRDFQQRLQNIKTDVLLHAPTGSGKTEAALSWVFANQSKNARLFYVLPYTASINAMVDRLQKSYSHEKVTALHSKTLDFFFDQLSDEDDNKPAIDIQQEAQSKKSLSRELFYPVKVTTPHQIIKYALRGKGWEISLFDFQNALFIIDEFHTYDALLTGLIFSSVKWLKQEFNAKFLFMSATIPDFMIRLIQSHLLNSSDIIRPNPLSESDREVLDRKRHRINCIREQTLLADINKIEQELKQDDGRRSVLVIANNVKTAQKLFRQINFNGSKTLLHGGFNRRSRISIEKAITHQDPSQRPQLLIATQAVEVSLDIDYDTAFIENAPIDALIQRLGRINRAGKKGISQIYLYETITGNTPFYNKDILKLTWKEMENLEHKSLSEQDLINACNIVYKDGYNTEQQIDFEKGLNNSVITNYRENLIAADWLSGIEEALEKNKQKVEVLCGNLADEYDSLIKKGRYIEANQLLVSVYPNESKQINRYSRNNTWTALDLFYDEKIGYTHNDDDVFL
jgi:CRISPR-associated endonuclease/helicase Cas3